MKNEKEVSESHLCRKTKNITHTALMRADDKRGGLRTASHQTRVKACAISHESFEKKYETVNTDIIS